MDERVKKYGEKAVKVSGAVFIATGVVALSSLVASGAAVGAVVEGFKSAKDTMKKILKEKEKSNEIIVDTSANETKTTEEENICN